MILFNSKAGILRSSFFINFFTFINFINFLRRYRIMVHIMYHIASSDDRKMNDGQRGKILTWHTYPQASGERSHCVGWSFQAQDGRSKWACGLLLSKNPRIPAVSTDLHCYRQNQSHSPITAPMLAPAVNAGANTPPAAPLVNEITGPAIRAIGIYQGKCLIGSKQSMCHDLFTTTQHLFADEISHCGKPQRAKHIINNAFLKH